MAIEYAFIIDFLRRRENLPPHFTPLLAGYVPSSKGKPIGQSGVTIATGCDLGQQSVEGLRRMGVPRPVRERLAPFCGLRRDDAVAALANIPLHLTALEAADLDAAVIGAYIREVAKRFDRDADKAGTQRFTTRHAGVQAALVSLRYQLGFGGFPKTWRMLVAGEYADAIAELRNPACWGGHYMERRRSEAGLLAAVKEVEE